VCSDKSLCVARALHAEKVLVNKIRQTEQNAAPDRLLLAGVYPGIGCELRWGRKPSSSRRRGECPGDPRTRREVQVSERNSSGIVGYISEWRAKAAVVAVPREASTSVTAPREMRRAVAGACAMAGFMAFEDGCPFRLVQHG
jgi:hypothetical protein